MQKIITIINAELRPIAKNNEIIYQTKVMVKMQIILEEN